MSGQFAKSTLRRASLKSFPVVLCSRECMWYVVCGTVEVVRYSGDSVMWVWLCGNGRCGEAGLLTGTQDSVRGVEGNYRLGCYTGNRCRRCEGVWRIW